MPKKIIKDKTYVGLVNELDDNDKRKAKYAKHFKKHGWEPTQLWNLDVTLAEIIHKYLVLYKKNTCAVIDFDIDSMIEAFETIKKEKHMMHTVKENEEIRKKLHLFAENFMKLWD